MGHDEAVRICATERYLLGELHSQLRDQFEEHLFDCQWCALDLQFATTFLEHLKVVRTWRPNDICQGPLRSCRVPLAARGKRQRSALDHD
jgi:hypothetical protein